jgi:hypothetical protein
MDQIDENNVTCVECGNILSECVCNLNKFDSNDEVSEFD